MMRRLTMLAAATLTLGAKQLVGYLRRKGGRKHDHREALQTWEGEGGAVLVSRSTTAAQVPPSSDGTDHAIRR